MLGHYNAFKNATIAINNRSPNNNSLHSVPKRLIFEAQWLPQCLFYELCGHTEGTVKDLTVKGQCAG